MKYYRGFEESYKSTEKAFAIKTWYNQTNRTQHITFVPKSKCTRDEKQAECILIPAWLVASSNLWNYVSEYTDTRTEISNHSSFEVVVRDIKDFMEEDGETLEDLMNERFVLRVVRRISKDICIEESDVIEMIREQF